jgi:hypothetical protein
VDEEWLSRLRREPGGIVGSSVGDMWGNKVWYDREDLGPSCRAMAVFCRRG